MATPGGPSQAGSQHAFLLPPAPLHGPLSQAPATRPTETRRPPPRPLRGTHVVFRLQRYLQDFGVAHDLLVAGGGDGFPRDPVHLVEGVGFQDPLVGRPDEDLKAEGLVFHVAVKLVGRRKQSQVITDSTAGRQGVAAVAQQTRRPEKLPGGRKSPGLRYRLEERRTGSSPGVRLEGTALIDYKGPSLKWNIKQP